MESPRLPLCADSKINTSINNGFAINSSAAGSGLVQHATPESKIGRQRRGRWSAHEDQSASKRAAALSNKNTSWIDVAKKLWSLAWPLSSMEVLTFTKELIITGFVGRLGPVELSALVLAQTVYNVTGNAPMLGVVAAMETFCGQAFGAKCFPVVGVVLQRALLIVLLVCAGAISMWARAEDLLLWMGQDFVIAKLAGQFTLMLAPCLLMDAVDQCCRRYLAAQSVVQPPMAITMLATLLTPLFLWWFIFKCGFGFQGAAIAWNVVQGMSLVLMLLFVLHHHQGQKAAERTWGGWSREAFMEWGLYIRVAVPSMVMICLDWWTFEVIVILSGLLPRPELMMSMMGITFNVHALCFMAAHGLSGAASTRIGNELGASRPRLAWLTVQVSVLMGMVIMGALSLGLMLGRHHLGWLFTTDKQVIYLTAQAVPPLAVSLIGEGANTVLAGVLRGCGRQKIGAIVNLVIYWGVGLPFSVLMAFGMHMGALGLWTGLACTASFQALLMTITVFRFDWSQEVQRARMLIASGEMVLDELDDVDLM